MPRDSSGNYTLPLGNPVAAATIIETTWANPTMSDIANQLNNVLTRDGLLSPITPFKIIDGTNIAPGLSFASQTSSGFWRNGAELGFSMLGVPRQVFDSAALRTTGRLLVNRDPIYPLGPLGGTVGAAWALRDSLVYGYSAQGLIGVAGYVDNTNQDLTAGQPTESIGIAGFVRNTRTVGVWGAYSDVQAELGSGGGLGFEIALKNKTAVSLTPTPYFNSFKTGGIWMPAGGDSSYGGPALNNNDVALAIGSSVSSGKKWNTGIVFFQDALQGADGSTGTALAIQMAKGHRITWGAPGNNAGFDIRSEVATAGRDVKLIAFDNSLEILGGGNSPMLNVSGTVGGTNFLNVLNATGVNPVVLEAKTAGAEAGMTFWAKGTREFKFFNNGGTTEVLRIGGLAVVPANFLHLYTSAAGGGTANIAALGNDSVIDISLEPKATGLVKFGTFTGSADVPVTGSILMRDATGVLRKLAVVA